MFDSIKFSPAELNYVIHDQEIVVAVDCIRELRHTVGMPGSHINPHWLVASVLFT